MKIAITTSYNNPYAGALTLRLMQQAAGEIVFIVVEPSSIQRAIVHLTHYGFYRWLQRLQHPPIRHHEFEQPAFMSYIKAYNLWDAYLSIVKLARRYGLRWYHSPHLNDLSVIKFVGQCDLLINAGGGIFGKALITAPRLGIINAHRGRLPEFRGMSPIAWTALMRQLPPYITVHFVAEGIDTGDILIQRKLPLTPAEVMTDGWRDKALPFSIELLLEAVAALRLGRMSRIPQLKAQGRQYYVMHSRLRAIAERRMAEWVFAQTISPSPDRSLG